jgi:hypothetical protein
VLCLGAPIGGRPSFPYAGKCERFIILEAKRIGLLALGIEFLPLVERIGGDQAAPLFEWMSPHGFQHERFGLGVDGGEAEQLYVLAPCGNQSPSHLRDFALASVTIQANDRLKRCGSDVVQRRDIEDGCPTTEVIPYRIVTGVKGRSVIQETCLLYNCGETRVMTQGVEHGIVSEVICLC